MATVVDAARKGVSIVVGAAAGGGTSAGWFGDGRDGDLYVADGETLYLDVAIDEGQIVKQYKNGYIGTGSLLTSANRCNGMILLFSGDLTVKGTISMDKKAPLLNPMEEQCAAEAHVALCGGLKGGNGGAAGTGYGNPANYAPGTGGNGFALGGGFGGGSAGGLSDGASGEPRPPIGTELPYRTAAGEPARYGAGGYSKAQGGGGPGGSGACDSYYSSQGPIATGNDGDAIGGGAIFAYVKGTLTIESTGIITADGGNGAAGVGTYKSGESGAVGSDKDATGGGGGAGGGIIAIIHNGDYTNMGSIAANGGVGGAKHSNGGAAGADGEAGTALVTTLSELLGK